MTSRPLFDELQSPEAPGNTSDKNDKTWSEAEVNTKTRQTCRAVGVCPAHKPIHKLIPNIVEKEKGNCSPRMKNNEKPQFI